MICPKCAHPLLRKSNDKVKLKLSILVFDEEGQGAVTNCPSCKEEIQVPITLEKSAIPDSPPLVLDKRRLTPPSGDP